MLLLDVSSQVWAITGNLGGGKTLTAVSIAVDSIRRGYYVITNITLNTAQLSRFVGKSAPQLYQHISMDDDIDFYTLPCGSPRGSRGRKRVLVIIDEVAEWMDQYQSARDGKVARFLSWLRHSSKRSQDVFLICQRADYINKSLRILVSRWVFVRDLAVYRLPVLHMRIPFCRDKIMQTVFDRMGNRISGVMMVRKSEYGIYYDTAECLNSSAGVYGEYSLPLKRPPRFLLLFALWFFLWLLAIAYAT